MYLANMLTIFFLLFPEAHQPHYNQLLINSQHLDIPRQFCNNFFPVNERFFMMEKEMPEKSLFEYDANTRFLSITVTWTCFVLHLPQHTYLL